MTKGHTEAEGYVASLRQMAQWIRDGNAADPDELDAAAEFIERHAPASAASTRLNRQLGRSMQENARLKIRLAELEQGQ